MIKVSELKGELALDALNGVYALLMGVKMLPEFESEPFEDFFERVANMERPQQERVIRLALGVLRPEGAALRGMVSFCKDPNGVRYSKENINSLTMPQLIDIIVAVSCEILSWDIGVLSNAEKKNSKTSA